MYHHLFHHYDYQMVLSLTIEFDKSADSLENTAAEIAAALLNNGDNLGHMNYRIVDHEWDSDNIQRRQS